MGGLGDHAGEMIYILLAILLIVAVMVTVMALSKTSKKNTNTKVNELGQQVDNVDNQFFEEWDQGNCNGSQLKIFMSQAKDKNCAVLVGTLSLLGTEPMYDGVKATIQDGTSEKVTDQKEATFNGAALIDGYIKQLPIVQISEKDGGSPHKMTENTFVLQTALGTKIHTPALINYGTILKNAVSSSGTKGESYESTLVVDGEDGSVDFIKLTTSDYDDNVDFGQHIAYLDGRFYTKLEFATSQSGRPLKYNNTTDWNSSGKMMNISDNAQFNTYVLQNISGDNMGVVFIQKRK